ncbi:MAG: hypothetical protein AcusKO_27960 [Acuticoccus sp.]
MQSIIDSSGGASDSRLAESQASLADLRRQLRRERAMGRGGHWAYSLSRHLALKKMVEEAQERCRRHVGSLAHAAP